MLENIIFEPTCAYARWALMHRFLYRFAFCLSMDVRISLGYQLEIIFSIAFGKDLENYWTCGYHSCHLVPFMSFGSLQNGYYIKQ